MSSSDDLAGAVLVEHDDAAPSPTPDLQDEAPVATEAAAPNLIEPDEEEVPKSTTTPHAIQIVSIGSEETGYAFQYDQAACQSCLERIPPEVPVAIVSVVGAFRTGKSFLLTWFLQYLHYLQTKGGSTSSEEEKGSWSKEVASVTSGFEWKGGKERNTTGMWMWSHPHLLTRKDGSQVAVLLVDTQGMFDHDTTMALTACIFGFSTLLSSFQIYNVDKRIQEDNLQQLALFSEYARMAVDEEKAPFQRMEFLVRDWQHFEDEDDHPDYAAMEASMEEYLQSVLATREASDLKETREQIVRCFQSITCYGLCHPGFAVTKKKFTGEVDQMEDLFVQLVSRYCSRVLDPEELPVKKVQGQTLTASSLSHYLTAYAALFESGAKFPDTGTLLDATASANNSNAVATAVTLYQRGMDRVAGPACSNYVQPSELEVEHDKHKQEALRMFKSIANFGAENKIAEAKGQVLQQIEKAQGIYTSLNDGRNPLAGLETYLLPLAIGLMAVILRWVSDWTCAPYSTICKATSETLSHTYAVVCCFLLIVAGTKAQQIRDYGRRVHSAFSAMQHQEPRKAKHD